MNPASDLLPDRYYRPTKNVTAGTYYTVPKTVDADDLIARLRRSERNGRDEWLLRELERGQVLLRRHRRYVAADGTRRESTEYTAVPPSHRFRRVKSKPAYAAAKRSGVSA